MQVRREMSEADVNDVAGLVAPEEVKVQPAAAQNVSHKC